MKKLFYHLEYPNDSSYQVYGRPEWESRFGTAEWSDQVGGLSTGRLLRPYGKPQVDLAIVLPSPKVGDFVWTWAGDCIVTENTLSLFTQAGFTGFEARPVTVEKIKRSSRKKRHEVTIPPLWELPIVGKGGDAAPESGIYPLYEIEDTGAFSYSSFRNGIIVDESEWDGSDFFTVNGYPKFILVTERVKKLIIERQPTNCMLIPSHKLEWGEDERPEDSLEEDRAMAARPLESLLEELESPEVSMNTVFALGQKRDPRAVEAVIGKFNDPDPFIWDTAADAVASIGRHKETPEEIRDQILARLKGLLDHEDPLVRRTAATALGRTLKERAGEDLVRLFDDPDEIVRDKAVFMIAHLRYTPALEAVKRLTRDRSKTVREMARIAVRELSAPCP